MILEKDLKRIYVDRKGNKYKFIEGVGCERCYFYKRKKDINQSCWDFQQYVFDRKEAPGCCEKHVIILIQDNLKLWRKI